MEKKEEIIEIIDWCEKIKKERKRTYIIERNPFAQKINFTTRFTLIEIDRPKEIASKTSLVYDSTTKSLWANYMGEWRKIGSKAELTK